MENKVLGVCAIAAVLGIISAATGYAAEATRVKPKIDRINLECVYPSSPALALGIASAAFTIITRIYISVLSGGAGCCRNDPKSTPASKLLFVFSWIASVLAVVLLLAAAGLSNRQSGEIDSYGYIKCYYVKPGVFAAGGTLALLSAVFGIAAYIRSTTLPLQTDTNPAIAFPVIANVDPERNPVPFPQQYPPAQNNPQQY